MTVEDTLFRKYLYIFLVVAAYWVISIATVFVNKVLLSSYSVNLNAPLFVTWFQCVVSYAICWTLSVTKGFNGAVYFPEGTPWEFNTIRQVLPLSILFIGMISFNNLCLKYVGVAFYYIGRSLTTVFNVVFTWTILGEKTDTKCIICCAIIVSGFMLGVDEESLYDSFSLIGTIFGVLGSLSLTLYSIHTKRVLPSVQNEVCLLSYYNNAYAIVLFVPLMLFAGEFQTVFNYSKLHDPFFWVQMMGGGVCGFAIGFVTSLQIKATTPLTHNVSGTAKACAQTVLASYWWNETKSGLWWAAAFLILGASAAYARFRQLLINKEHRRKQTLETVKL